MVPLNNINNLRIWTDGGARGNPGPAAIGVYIEDEKGEALLKHGKKIGYATNNVAEYQAVIEALTWLKESSLELSQVDFFLDSSLVVNQLNGVFRIKENHLRDLIIFLKNLEKKINTKIIYHLVPREKNKVADFLVNQALDQL